MIQSCWTARFGLAAAMTMVGAAACDSETAASNDAGKSGSSAGSEADNAAGSAGSSAAAGTGGAGSGGASGFGLPGCLRELLASCGAEGACRVQHGQSGAVDRRYCFDSGARAELEPPANCSGLSRSELRVAKADGSPCYTVEGMLGTACEFGEYTFRNAAGATVATGEFSSGMGTRIWLDCAEGESVSCAPPNCPMGDFFAFDGCEPGDCSE
jgi:hypothetical protein